MEIAFNPIRPLAASATAFGATGRVRQLPGGTRFGADNAGKAASGKNAQQQDSGFSIKKSCLFPLIGFVVIPLIPLSWSVAALAALTLGIPLFAKFVNPKFENGNLTNKTEVLRNAVKIKNRLSKVLTAPLKLVPDCLNIANWRTKATQAVSQGGKFLIRKAFSLFKNDSMKGFISNVPKSFGGKILYFGKWFLMLFALALEKKVEKKAGCLGWIVGGILGANFLKDMRTRAHSMLNELLPDEVKKNVPPGNGAQPAS